PQWRALGRHRQGGVPQQPGRALAPVDPSQSEDVVLVVDEGTGVLRDQNEGKPFATSGGGFEMTFQQRRNGSLLVLEEPVRSLAYRRAAGGGERQVRPRGDGGADADHAPNTAAVAQVDAGHLLGGPVLMH